MRYGLDKTAEVFEMLVERCWLTMLVAVSVHRKFDKLLNNDYLLLYCKLNFT